MNFNRKVKLTLGSSEPGSLGTKFPPETQPSGTTTAAAMVAKRTLKNILTCIIFVGNEYQIAELDFRKTEN